MTSWLLHSFEAVTLLMLLVLALRRPVARLFGAGWAYALWLIPAFRLVLPPLPLPAQDLPPSAAVLIPTASDMAAPPPVFAGPGQWVPFLLACWAGGAAIFIILQWLGYRAFLRRLDGTARPARPARYGGIATFVSRMVEGPLALGLIEPRIFLPADFSRRYSPGERRLAMEHELTHHRHRDIWWNMAAIAMLAVNWFNPLAWLAYRAFRADQELACDAAVAARATIEERCDYARALVKSAAGPGLIAACPINGAGALKRRLRMLRGHRASPLRSAGGMAALSVLAVAGATSATLRSDPEMPRLLVAAVARPAPVAAPVRLAAAMPAAEPKRSVHDVARTVVRTRREDPLRLADADVPTVDLPPFAPQPQPPGGSDERPPALVLASGGDVPETPPDTPDADTAPAPAQPAYALLFHLSESAFERAAARKPGKGRTIVYRVVDPATQKAIEIELRKAAEQTRKAQRQTRAQTAQLFRVAQRLQVRGGVWANLNFQIVEQGD
ncbi:MAG TPA: M56 family metallopeptidase [Allosphingosinicella sp.]|jgi:beta-lactamase regulating signal transducer with metallopeptidase domain